jgi:CYTH domain-containing protein/thymidylate kinase
MTDHALPTAANRDTGEAHTPPPVTHIVFDGGPCAGKSTALAVIPEDLAARNIGCLVVSEAATRTIGAGFPIAEALAALPDDPRLMHILQVAIASQQLSDFDHYDQMAYALSQVEGRRYVVLHDRYVCTNKAYIGADAFEDLLDELGITMYEARDRIDAVIHMVTAAEGAEEFYTNANNATRLETPEQARELDLKTSAAWHGHEHLKVIDNSTDFDGKLARVRAEVLNAVAEPPTELERKFLLSAMPARELLDRAIQTEIRQTYLLSTDGLELRVRQSTQGRHQRWTRTTKGQLPDGGRAERSKSIDHRTYLELLHFADPSLSTVTKTRHSFTGATHYFELDEFHSPDELTLLEVEVASMDDEIDMPEWLTELIVREVTDDPDFKSRAIAARGQGAPA